MAECGCSEWPSSRGEVVFPSYRKAQSGGPAGCPKFWGSETSTLKGLIAHWFWVKPRSKCGLRSGQTEETGLFSIDQSDPDNTGNTTLQRGTAGENIWDLWLVAGGACGELWKHFWEGSSSRHCRSKLCKTAHCSTCPKTTALLSQGSCGEGNTWERKREQHAWEGTDCRWGQGKGASLYVSWCLLISLVKVPS